MLTHENLFWTAAQFVDLLGFTDEDCGLSFLPLSHIAEQLCSIHIPIVSTGAIYYAESLEAVPENLQEIEPTVFVAVPRLWEKFHAKISERLSNLRGPKKGLITWAQRLCSRSRGAG